jgi:hypothetical protein
MSTLAPSKRANPTNTYPGDPGLCAWFTRMVLSTVGGKFVVALTGAALTLFVVIHMIGNLQIFAGQNAINNYAEALKSFGALLWVFASLAGVYGVGLLCSRLEQAGDKVLAAMTKGLSAVHERVRDVQERVRESKGAVAMITQGFEEWWTKKSKEPQKLQAAIEGRAEQMAQGLQTADSWLEAAAESMRGIQQVLDLSHAVGGPMDTTALTQLMDKLTALRHALQKTAGTVDGIRAFATAKGGGSGGGSPCRRHEIVGANAGSAGRFGHPPGRNVNSTCRRTDERAAVAGKDQQCHWLDQGRGLFASSLDRDGPSRPVLVRLEKMSVRTCFCLAAARRQSDH